jgi:hypothetical protein
MMEAVRVALLQQLPELLRGRASNAHDALGVAHDLLRPEPLGVDEPIFITGYITTRRVRVVRTPAFAVLEVDVVAEPQRNAEVCAAAFEFVGAAQADEDARSFCRESGCSDGSNGGSSDLIEGGDIRRRSARWCESVPIHPLYRRLSRVLAALVSGGDDGCSDDTAASAINAVAVAALKLPSSPLLEALEVKPLATYIDGVVGIVSSCARAAAVGDGADSHSGAGAGGGGVAGVSCGCRRGRHDDDDVRAAVRLALAVARRLSSKQTMALLGMRHTRASPEWASPPPYAALYAVSSSVGACCQTVAVMAAARFVDAQYFRRCAPTHPLPPLGRLLLLLLVLLESIVCMCACVGRPSSSCARTSWAASSRWAHARWPSTATGTAPRTGGARPGRYTARTRRRTHARWWCCGGSWPAPRG